MTPGDVLGFLQKEAATLTITWGCIGVILGYWKRKWKLLCITFGASGLRTLGSKAGENQGENQHPVRRTPPPPPQTMNVAPIVPWYDRKGGAVYLLSVIGGFFARLFGGIQVCEVQSTWVWNPVFKRGYNTSSQGGTSGPLAYGPIQGP